MAYMPEYKLFSELDNVVNEMNFDSDSNLSPGYYSYDNCEGEINVSENITSKENLNKKYRMIGETFNLGSSLTHFDNCENMSNCNVNDSSDPSICFSSNQFSDNFDQLDQVYFNNITPPWKSDEYDYNFSFNNLDFTESDNYNSIDFKKPIKASNNIVTHKTIIDHNSSNLVNVVENLPTESIEEQKDISVLSEIKRNCSPSLLPVKIVVKKLVSGNTEANMVAPFTSSINNDSLIPISSEAQLSECEDNCQKESYKIRFNEDIKRKSLRLKNKKVLSNDNIYSEMEKLKPQDLPFTSLKRKLSNTNKSNKRKRRVKAYELQPLPDPLLERCRRNAVNAKKNREIQKARMKKLETELEEEREEKVRLANENEYLKQRNQELEKKLSSLKDVKVETFQNLNFIK